MPRRNTYDVGDVAVIGAGGAGVVIALLLSELGLEVALIDREGFAAGQSGHSHGYLHQGAIYTQPDPHFVAELQRGTRAWQQILAGLGVEPITETSSIVFTERLNAEAAERSWEEAGLVLRSTTELPPGFAGERIAATYESAEPVVDFTPVFQALGGRLNGVTTIRADVRRLLRHGPKIDGALVSRRGEEIVVKARYYVLAAGTGNQRLLELAGRLQTTLVIRSSFMLVVKGNLPPTSTIVPERESYGLFIVSRSCGTGFVWLVSDYVSYAGGVQAPFARSAWVKAVRRTLTDLVPATAARGVSVGVYTGPKAEIRPVPYRMSGHSIESYGLTNLLAVAPTKLTLAPLLAEETTERVSDALPKQRGEMPLPTFPERDQMTVLPERWQSVLLAPAASRAEHAKEAGIS
jgi:glycine/D-amino acid oxidase-like deaminating enzyme